MISKQKTKNTSTTRQQTGAESPESAVSLLRERPKNLMIFRGLLSVLLECYSWTWIVSVLHE